MRRFARGLTLLPAALASWCSLTAPPTPAAGPPPAPPCRAKLASLVADLCCEDVVARAAAARRLGDLPHVPLALRDAAGAGDAAVRRRVAKVVAAIERRVAPLALARAAAWAKQGEVDLAREAVAVWGPRAGKDLGWQVMTSLAGEIRSRQEKALKSLRIPNPARQAPNGAKFVLPAGDFERYRKAIRPKLVEGEDVALDNAAEQVVRATGQVSLRAGARGLQNSLVIACGDFAALAQGRQLHQRVGLGCSVVFAGGDVEIDGAGDALIVCSGEARLRGWVGTSVVIARGPVRIADDFTLGRVNLILSAGKIEKTGEITPDALVKGGVARPLGFVRFFETARVGIEVAKAKNRDGARIVKLGHASAFARAGLWRDDVVTAVDGAAVKTPEQFRRAVLRRLVEGGEAELRVWREGERMTVYVTPRL